MSDSSLTIAEGSEQISAGAAAHMPQEVVATFDALTGRLREAGIPADVAKPGDRVDDVDLLSAHAEPTSLYEAIDGRPTVIVLYRGVWCPFCNLALKHYSDHLLAPLSEHHVGLVAVSPQKPDGSLSMQETNDLTFPVLSDPGNSLAKQLGVLMPAVGEDVLAVQRQLGTDLTEANADGTEFLPMPTVLVIDAEHRIGWIDVHPDFTTRTEVQEILDAVEALI